MIRRLVMAGLALLAAGVVTAAQAAENLVLIATEKIDLSKGGTASIDVSKAKGAFQGIRIRAKKGIIDVSQVRVAYSDGTFHLEERQIDMKEGERSRPIDLKSADRFVDTVAVTFKSGKGAGTVEVYGIQTKDGAKKKRSGTAPAPSAEAKPKSDIVAGPTSDKPDESKPGTYDGYDVMFGYQDVGFVVDSDVLKVGGNIGKFDRIRLRVLKNEVHVNSIKVTYLDGETQDLVVDANVPANTRTKWLDIKGDKFIKELRLNYRSKPDFNGQARVEVSGQYAEGWLGPNGEGKKYNEGWVLLGSQTADFAGYDTDSITIGKNSGGFARLRVEVRESPITLTKIQVNFVSGPDETFKFGRERIDPGKPFGPIEFKGGKAVIKEIKAQYRTRYDLLGKLAGGKSLTDFKPAVVEIWGQH